MFRVGVMIRHTWPIKTSIEYAKFAEKMGFHCIWAPSRYFSRDPFVTLAAIAGQTDRIRLGAAVVDVHSRHPAVIAGAIANLYELSNGRADLGVSAGVWTHSLKHERRTDWRHSVQRVRESVLIIKSLLAGESVTFHGKEFSLDGVRLIGEPNRNIRVFVAAEGPKMIKLAAEVSDGLITTKGPAAHTSRILDQFFDALKETGRPRWQTDVILQANLAVGDTMEKAVELIRPYVAEGLSHLSVSTCELLGLDMNQMDLYRREPGQLPDELIKQFAVCGTVDDCLAQVEELKRQGVNELFLWYPEFHPDSKFSIDQIKERELLMETVSRELLPRLH